MMMLFQNMPDYWLKDDDANSVYARLLVRDDDANPEYARLFVG